MKSRLYFMLILIGFSFSSAFSQQPELMLPSEVFANAEILYDSGRFAETIVELKKIPERDTAYTEMLTKLTHAFLSNKDYDSAIAVCRKQLEKPSDERTYYLRMQAVATERKGDYKGALQLFDDALKQYPTDIPLLYNLGLAYYNNKDYEKAKAIYFRILQVNPYHPGSHLNLARLAVGQGRKVHAMLSAGLYLTVNEGDNSILVLMNNFLDNQVTDEGSIPAAGANGAQRLDQMIRAKIVMEKDFKSAFPVSAAIIRQYELLFDQLGSLSASGDDPYLKHYLPIYKSIKDNNAVEAFVYHILTSSSIEAAKKWRSKHEKELGVFYNLTNEGLKKQREFVNAEAWGYKEPVSAWHNGTSLTAVGKAEGENRVGHWVFIHPNSEKSAEGDYGKDGEKTGTWKYFYDNGNVKSIENYETGEVTVYAPEGEKREHFFLKDDEIEGEVELYYTCGPVKEKVKFVAGMRDGNSQTFYTTGEPRATAGYKQGQLDGPYVSLYLNGKVYERTAYKEGALHGKYESYNTNGTLRAIGEYVNDNPVGPWKFYHPNGKLMRSGSYSDKGIPFGEWVYYDREGVVTEKRNFDAEGRYDGDITYYQDGKLYYTSTYKKDMLVKNTFYDDQGKVINSTGSNDGSFYSKNYFSTGELRSEGKNVKGKAEGVWKFYDRFGKLVSEYNYKNDMLEGEAKDFFPSGEKKIVSSYKEGKLHGYYRQWFRHGILQAEGWYQNGEREQKWVYYYQDGTVESDYYYSEGEAIGMGYNYAIDGKIHSGITMDEGVISDLQYYDSKSARSSVKRSEKSADVFEEFYSNKKLKSRYDVLCGSYTNAWQRFFPDGSIHYRYDMANGDKNGKFVSYDLDGSMLSQGTYENDERVGKWKTYFDNGKLYSEGIYVEDNRDSLWTYYHDNGKLSSTGAYRHNERHGSVIYYDPNGNPLIEKTYINGDFISYRSLVGGTPGEWIKFSGNGKVEIKYPNGNVAFEENYKDGQQHSFDRLYFENGTLYKEFVYDMGDLAGPYSEYHPNGKIKERGIYKYDEADGKVETYYDDGSLERTVIYKLGYRQGPVVLYEKGAKKMEINFWNGIIEY